MVNVFIILSFYYYHHSYINKNIRTEVHEEPLISSALCSLFLLHDKGI